MGMDYSIRFILSDGNEKRLWNAILEEQCIEYCYTDSCMLAFRPDEMINQYLKETYEVFEVSEVAPSFTDDGKVWIGLFDMEQKIVQNYCIVEFRSVCDSISQLIEVSCEIRKWIVEKAEVSGAKYAYIDKEGWEPLEIIYNRGSESEVAALNAEYNNEI